MKEQIKKLNRLISENPDMPVKMFVDNEERAMDFEYTAHDIKKVEISYWYDRGEDGYYTEEDDLVSDLIGEGHCLWQEEAEAIAAQGKMVILITTEAV